MNSRQLKQRPITLGHERLAYQKQMTQENAALASTGFNDFNGVQFDQLLNNSQGSCEDSDTPGGNGRYSQEDRRTSSLEDSQKLRSSLVNRHGPSINLVTQDASSYDVLKVPTPEKVLNGYNSQKLSVDSRKGTGKTLHQRASSVNPNVAPRLFGKATNADNSLVPSQERQSFKQFSYG